MVVVVVVVEVRSLDGALAIMVIQKLGSDKMTEQKNVIYIYIYIFMLKARGGGRVLESKVEGILIE